MGGGGKKKREGGMTRYQALELTIDAAWTRSRGWGRVGVWVDEGGKGRAATSV